MRLLRHPAFSGIPRNDLQVVIAIPQLAGLLILNHAKYGVVSASYADYLCSFFVIVRIVPPKAGTS